MSTSEQQSTSHAENRIPIPAEIPPVTVTRVSLRETREGGGGMPPGEAAGRGDGPTFRTDGVTEQSKVAPPEVDATPRRTDGKFAKRQDSPHAAAQKRAPLPRTFAEALKGKIAPSQAASPAAEVVASEEPKPTDSPSEIAAKVDAAPNGKTNGAAKDAPAAKQDAAAVVEDKVTSAAFIELNKRSAALRQTEEATKAAAAAVAAERAALAAERAKLDPELAELRAFKAMKDRAKGDPLGWLKLGGLELEQAMRHKIDHGDAPTADYLAEQRAKEAEERLRAEYSPKLEAIDKALKEANQLREQAKVAEIRREIGDAIGKVIEADPDRYELTSRYRRTDDSGRVFTGRDEVMMLIESRFQASGGKEILPYAQAADMIEEIILKMQEPFKGSKKLGYASPAQDTATPDARSKASPPQRTMTNSQVSAAVAPAPRGYASAADRRKAAIGAFRASKTPAK